MVELKINFLAMDFDQTMIDVHTGGVWRGTAGELSERVRPMFKNMVEMAHAAGIMMAVVTFSGQIGLIREFLRIHFPEYADTIVIRGRDGSWRYEGSGSRSGKQSFMASAVEELLTMNPDAEITKSTTLLIDDDRHNIKYALDDGVRAVWLNPRKSHRALADVRNLI